MFAESGFNFPPTQSGGFFPSPVPGSKKPGSALRTAQFYAPVTVAMIHQMLPSQGTLRIGSYEVPHVTVVGIVRSVVRDQLHVDYMIDDMTGPPIAVRKYINVEHPTSNVVAMENTYVKVCGSIKNFEGKKSIAALGMVNLTDLNALTAHLLEVTQCKLFYTKDYIKQVVEKGTGGTMGLPAFPAVSATLPPQNQPFVISGLTGFNAEIFQYLAGCQNEEGYSMDEVQKRFSHVPPLELKRHLNFLLSEGHLYSTIDDFHFKVTDA